MRLVSGLGDRLQRIWKPDKLKSAVVQDMPSANRTYLTSKRGKTWASSSGMNKALHLFDSKVFWSLQCVQCTLNFLNKNTEGLTFVSLALETGSWLPEIGSKQIKCVNRINFFSNPMPVSVCCRPAKDWLNHLTYSVPFLTQNKKQRVNDFYKPKETGKPKKIWTIDNSKYSNCVPL